jgi:hypothetical protein
MVLSDPDIKRVKQFMPYSRKARRRPVAAADGAVS